jgi:aldehyde dehydrogenase (NAD+)
MQNTSSSDYNKIVGSAHETFLAWRQVPAPERGEVIREIADALRARKKELGAVITKEVGKILAEGEGEIQEAIDIADFAVGLSRQLYGNTMHSERPQHRMYEQWHPLGPIGVITAFNFPAAVWAWNAFIAAVCGNSIVWKPSEMAQRTAKEMNGIASEVAARKGFPNLFSVVFGEGKELGVLMAQDKRLPLISATGSCQMGKSVAATVAARLGRSLLELGGNNAVIILDDADLSLVVPSTLFGSVGTAGQRCTSTRRLFVQKGIEKQFLSQLVSAYKQVKIGDPLKADTLMGPLINEKAVKAYQDAISQAKKEGGEVLYGGNVLKGMPSNLYVEPTIIKMPSQTPIVYHETFAPVLYVMTAANLEEALQLNNQVSQGLSSAIFTANLRSAESFLSHAGSDCGIANVNLGTSGAEIGGAFGGEKETGGGREAGSDSWKNYMRRQTNTINYSAKLPLAQGIKFDLSI